MKKFLLLISSAALLSVISSCSHTEEDEIEDDIKYIVTSPLVQDTTVLKDYVCQIRSIQHIELRALEKGYLQNIYVDEGQTVKKGQLMFQIMPLLYKAEYMKAKAEVDYAQIEYRNTKSLADSNVVSKNELALARANLDRAIAQMQMAKVHLGFTEIRAPFDGIMDRFNVRLGSLVDEGELLSTLSDNSKLWVYFNVPESEYIDYARKHLAGDKIGVQLMMANNELYEHGGFIETIEADFNNETGNIAFRANFPNPNRLLRHGETGNILMESTFKNAIIIPQKATFEILEKKYVFIVDKKNIVHQVEVKIAAEMPDLYVIAGGLKKDSKIVLEGIRKVKDGDKIAFTFQNPKDVIPKLNVYVE
ncbi:MAG: efflux RND transporter periplasmic adaptor subunit [Bacteroidota bacterium]